MSTMDECANKKMYKLILDMGIEVKPHTDLPEMQQFYGNLHQAFGMFYHFEPNHIYIFERCPNDILEYVLAHELGHLLSMKLDHDMFKFSLSYKPGDVLNEEQAKMYRNLLYKEEYRADRFSLYCSGLVGFESPTLALRRISNQLRYINLDQLPILNDEVNKMLSQFKRP